ncbi:MAG: hypothetical protein NVSMB39_5690 [Candidatus Saccharimonadales bacterium]
MGPPSDHHRDLENRVKAIAQLNLQVTSDKAWETSAVRRLSIAALTCIGVVIYLTAIHNSAPLANGIVPAMGYLVSILVLARIKRQ